MPFADPLEILVISPNQTVNESNTLTLNCTAGGKPLPVITWTKVSNNNIVSFPLTITGKEDEGSYRCIADNGVGSPARKDVFVTVASKIILKDIFMICIIINYLKVHLSSRL